MLDYPFPRPAHGEPTEVAAGVRWLRMPLPFALDHINLWLLEGAGERVLVDTGVASDRCRSHWEALLPRWAPTQILVTHFHPDHLGLARWLQSRSGAPVWMTRHEFAAADRLMGLDDETAGAGIAGFFRLHGLDEERAQRLQRRGNTYRPLVDGIPEVARFPGEGERLALAGGEWRVIIGRGHAPEHACLFRERDAVLISGDQLLPRISSNVSVPPHTPDADPLAEFLAALDRLDGLPAETLVLPSHGRPFRGLHRRTAQLRAHHAEHLEHLGDAARSQPLNAASALPLLFDRELDAHSLFFAMGEAIAHLNHLWHADVLERRCRDGVLEFAAP
ncbi:MBL fold metallo-hydrolase [Arhodomonas sp. SL1]|uniref:MBL fold metallo-hydrolase n=1 Tax=Arhodomonas sp. SL1 TaxID=3425691 RepID=UPI003F881108